MGWGIMCSISSDLPAMIAFFGAGAVFGGGVMLWLSQAGRTKEIGG